MSDARLAEIVSGQDFDPDERDYVAKSELLDGLLAERRISEWLANELAINLYDPTHPTPEELIAEAEEATK